MVDILTTHLNSKGKDTCCPKVSRFLNLHRGLVSLGEEKWESGRIESGRKGASASKTATRKIGDEKVRWISSF